MLSVYQYSAHESIRSVGEIVLMDGRDYMRTDIQNMIVSGQPKSKDNENEC